jgi:hypothetical protein
MAPGPSFYAVLFLPLEHGHQVLIDVEISSVEAPALEGPANSRFYFARLADRSEKVVGRHPRILLTVETRIFAQDLLAGIQTQNGVADPGILQNFFAAILLQHRFIVTCRASKPA